ncbi:hypothetical protein B0H21DRAFT_819149 [Amylocystis lapponica]|nr:hypothetical protein B0H21DRAFT_819149 [Amylocystis lapponica]
MAEFLQRLDPSKLVLVETVLSFAVSAFDAPSYNLPIFLFGIYTQENSEAFTALLGGSMVYDIVWMAKHSQHWFVHIISILLLLIKIPATLVFVVALQQRGTQFSSLGFHGSDLGGATVWSMPGGFTSAGSNSRGGYQTVDESAEVQTPKPLGSSPTNNGQPAAPGAYQSV